MKYEQRSVYIVKDADLGYVLKVFGVESEAESYSAKIGRAMIDEWPVEFMVEEQP